MLGFDSVAFIITFRGLSDSGFLKYPNSNKQIGKTHSTSV